MTGEQFDAPNQQAVRGDGSAPWEKGTGGSGGQGSAKKPKPAKPAKTDEKPDDAGGEVD